MDSLTFVYPPRGEQRFVNGTVLNPDGHGQDLYNLYHDTSLVVFHGGGLPNLKSIWTSDSIDRAKERLSKNYVALVVCLAGTVFALSEGALGGPPKHRRISAR